jgi:hypothetical protein
MKAMVLVVVALVSLSGPAAAQQRQRRPPSQPRHHRRQGQPGAQAYQRQHWSRCTGRRHRRQQTQHRYQGAGQRAGRGPRGRTQPLPPSQHHQAHHEGERACPAHRRGQPG